MRLTRRNALIGLGTVAAGAGVIGGTGAFTSVDADRSVSISSTTDGSANVQIVVNEVQGLSDTGGDTVSLSFESLNQNAVTDFDGALSITPQGSNGPYDVTATMEDGSGNNVSWVTTTVSNGTNINGGTTASVDIEIDLTNNVASDFPTDAVIAISVSQAA
jgi:hypothetical protein